MRLTTLLCLLIASLCLSGCVDSLRSQQPPAKPATGFWFWNGSSRSICLGGGPLGVVFVHGGIIRQVRDRWFVHGELPEALPAAREYWVVFRYERQLVPDLAAAPELAREVSRLRED